MKIIFMQKVHIMQRQILFIFKFTDNAEKYKDRKVNVSLMQIINFKTTLKSGNYNLELKVGNQIFENTKTIAFSSDASTSNVFQETEVKEKRRLSSI